MTARLSRRGLAGLLTAATASTAGAPLFQSPQGAPRYRMPPDAHLAEIARELLESEDQFAALPEDHPRQQIIIDRMDGLIFEAAMVRPVSDQAFAVKARLAQMHGEFRPGEVLNESLLCDLMARAGWGA